MINMLKKMQTQAIKSFMPRREAVHDFNQHIAESMNRTILSAGCRGWYKDGTVDGPCWAASWESDSLVSYAGGTKI
ncbi:hypothetical protein F5884DRAFT_769293 [Xylogone sp. PMI_703]|nr:hypothetical protein F5884DRAFT_769293 [Xylogone sp. PMI_703]